MTEEHSLTERSRDVLFFAKYYSSPDKPRPVKAEHILLAMLLVDPRLFQLLSATAPEEIVGTLKRDLKAFDPEVHNSWQATESPPFSSEAKQVIARAAEESKHLGHTRIGTEHLLLGLIRSQVSEQAGESPAGASEILQARGFSVELVTTQVQAGSLTPQSGRGYRSSILRALPASSHKGSPKHFRFIGSVLQRLRGLFVFLLVLGWATPNQFMELSRTRQRALVKASRQAKPVTYFALGDSTGVGLGAQNGYGYIEQLMTRIETEHPGSHLVKLCTLGETTGSLLQRLPESFSVKPTFVTLSIGINDLFQRISEQEFRANYEEIVKSLKQLSVPLIVTNLPDISLAPGLPNAMRGELHVKVLIFNKQIEDIAKRYRLFFVDLYGATVKTLTKHQEFFASDGFHPSDAGYRFWTRTMWPTVRTAIKNS